MNFIVSVHILIILYQSQPIMQPIVSILYVMYVFDSGSDSDGLLLTHLTVLAHWIVCASVWLWSFRLCGCPSVCNLYMVVFFIIIIITGLQHTICLTTFGLCGLLHGSTDWPCVVCQDCVSVSLYFHPHHHINLY